MKRWVVMTTSLLGALGACAFVSDGAQAHPHVLVEAQERLVFDQRGNFTGVEGVWTFDDAFSAYAVQGYDTQGDGLPTREDLQPLAKTNMDSLKLYRYFTQVKMDARPIDLGEAVDFWDEFTNEKLVVHFTLPLAHPRPLASHTISVEVFDADYFAAVSFPTAQATSFPGEPQGCTGSLRRPVPLDSSTASRLAEIPASQHELPPDLHAITDKLVNAIIIQCR